MKKNKILIIGFGYVGKYLGALFLKNNISFDVLDIKKNVKEDFYIFLKNQKHNFDDRQELNFLDYNAINTEYDYNWITPIEDIKSPFLLNLTINGNVLGDAINTTFSRLPQRDKWSSQQINFGLKQKFFSISQ